MTPVAPRIWYVGLDSFDPDLLRIGADAGDFPHLAALLRRGARATVANSEGLYVGAVSPCFSTATGARRHGRACYDQLLEGTYRSRVFGVRELREPAFWVRASEAGLRCAVVDVPKALLHPGILGAHVVDWGTHDPEADGTGIIPAALERRVRETIGPAPVRTCDEVRRTAPAYARFRDDLIERARRRERIVEAAIEEVRPTLVATTFTESHCSGHQLWHLHDPRHDRHDPALRAELGDPYLDVLKAIDAGIGRLLARAPSDARILVLATHGMGPHYDGVAGFDEGLERLEPHLPAGRPPSLRGRLGRLLDRRTTRRWNRSLAKRFGRTIPCPPRAAGRTSFMIPNNDAWAGVRVNLVGREPQGRIRPGAEYDAYLERLGALLAELRNGATGGPAFARIVRADAVHPRPHADAIPDLLAEWSREAPIPSLVSERIGRVDAPYKGLRTGDHRSDGLAIVAGPGIPAGDLGRRIPIEDLAPTLLAWGGVDWPGVDGRPVSEWCPAP